MGAVTSKTVERANAHVVYLEKKAECDALAGAVMAESDPVKKAHLVAALKKAQLEKQAAGRTWRGSKRSRAKKSNNPAAAVLKAAGLR